MFACLGTHQVHQMESLSQFRARLQAGKPVCILGLGDSLTFGWDVNLGFFDRFIKGLQRFYANCEIHSTNAGVPGDTALGGLSRLVGLLGHKPDLAVVQFGLNDCFSSIDTTRYAQALSQIVERLQQAGVVAVLCSSCSVSHLAPAMVESIEAYYESIEAVGKQCGVVVARLHRYWESQAGVDVSLFGADGIHPTDRGHQLMADGLLHLFDPTQVDVIDLPFRGGSAE